MKYKIGDYVQLKNGYKVKLTINYMWKKSYYLNTSKQKFFGVKFIEKDAFEFTNTDLYVLAIRGCNEDEIEKKLTREEVMVYLI